MNQDRDGSKLGKWGMPRLFGMSSAMATRGHHQHARLVRVEI